MKTTNFNITAMNEENGINNISKDIILNDLIEHKSFLKREQKFNSNIEKRKQEPEKLNVETKVFGTCDDSTWKKRSLIMGDSDVTRSYRTYNVTWKILEILLLPKCQNCRCEILLSSVANETTQMYKH